jgi:hypothetical protein
VPVLEPPLSVELDFGDLGLEFELYLAADAAVNANNDEETFRRHSVAA